MFLITYSPILFLVLLLGLFGLGRAIRGPREDYFTVDPRKRVTMGIAYFGLGKVEQAMQDLDEVIRLDSQNAKAYAFRALAYTTLGNDVQAQQDVDRASELGFDGAARIKEAIEEYKKQR